MTRLHVAVLDEELPYPLTSGKRIRTFNLLTRLAAKHRVTFISHRNHNADELSDAGIALRRHDIFPIVVNHEIPQKSGLGFYGRLARNLVSPLPYSVASHTSRQFNHAVDHLLRNDPPDLWHCEWTPYAQAMHRRPVPWVVMAHNVESLIWQRYAETEIDPFKRWFITKQWKRFQEFEGWAYSTANRTIAVSQEDADLIQRDFGAENVAVVDNGVDIDYFTPSLKVERDPNRLLFLGSLDWRPNQDAVTYFLDAIFPLVLQQEPDAKLSIVGRKPPQWLQARLAKSPNVELHADVPDVRPHVHSAGQLIVPLRIGGGSRLKILEALASELPVVTTSIGVEGLRLNHQEHCTVADNPEPFAIAVMETMTHPKAAHLLAVRGRNKVLAEYNWDVLADKMDQVWQETAQKKGLTKRELVAA